MTRERNKPTQSWVEKTKYELEHEEELTIERAYELGKIRGEKEQKAIDDKHYEDIIANECTASYESGLEQGRRDIIDKACEWLESHFRDIENPDFYSKRNHPTDLESMYYWSVKELVNDFRKAMGE